MHGIVESKLPWYRVETLYHFYTRKYYIADYITDKNTLCHCDRSKAVYIGQLSKGHVTVYVIGPTGMQRMYDRRGAALAIISVNTIELSAHVYILELHHIYTPVLTPLHAGGNAWADGMVCLPCT